jgi:4-amino-4-deoxy-L-arabinose transferase-like glycosyltransferase
MDDVDAVQAQIARNMLDSGDWVTARLNGVAYLEKSPLIYWTMASSYRIFGVHDWAARLPLALLTILLCWFTYKFARWALDEEASLFAGLAMATSIGLFLFTRILIPDAALTLTIAVAIWAALRLLEEETASTRLSVVAGVALGAGLLLKGLIAVVFPIGAVCLYLMVTKRFFSCSAWKRLRLHVVIAVALIVAVPWHAMAILRNPPYFNFSFHSGPGEYKGFFWFYFFNEHLLRFLNLRYPRDYNTVPRALFWLFNLIWFFPWSFYLAGAFKTTFRADDRASRLRLMCLCWIAVVMGFFTFSTTQEYYSMPIYPAMAILIGSSLTGSERWFKYCTRAVMMVSALVAIALGGLLFLSRGYTPTANIADALAQHPELYTLSLGHMGDLTVHAFAYLRLPLAIALAGVLVGFAATIVYRHRRFALVISLAVMMTMFLNAARVAMVTFDPYLSSYPLAQELEKSPPGKLIEADAYYAFSSVFFYTNRRALLLNGRVNNLEYGSNAPGAPQVFIEDTQFRELWGSRERYYLLIYGEDLPHIKELAGSAPVIVVKKNADNYLLTNLPLK